MSVNEDIRRVREAINEGGEHFFFICNDVIHSLGFLGLFNDFSIITYLDSPLAALLRESGINAYFAGDGRIAPDTLMTTNNLIANDFTGNVISGCGGKKNLLVFKNSLTVEESARRMGLRLLAAPAKISRGIENKISFFSFLNNKGVNLPPGGIIAMDDDAHYSDIVDKYGSPFVLQASKGFGGSKTYLIKDETGFEDIKKLYSMRRLKLTKYLSGQTLTINACATRLGTMVKPPFHQLTGIAQLTANPMGACGNDFDISDIDETLAGDIMKCTELIGDMIYKKGFRGLFGVDYIVSHGKYYFIECNPRFVTSLPAFTKLEAANGEPSLVAFHILEYTDNIHKVKDIFDKYKRTSNRYSGSQIIMHNLHGVTRKIQSDIKLGIYKIIGGDFSFVREAGVNDDMLLEGEFLIIPKPIGTRINSGIECARMLMSASALKKRRDDLLKAIKSLHTRLFGQ